jgi:hypothetical protein
MVSYDQDGRCIAKIIDLGIAKDLANNAAADTTQVGVLIGNPKYMSPEQLGLLNDGEQIDGRTDLYSLGVVLYEIVAGAPPFISDTSHGYIMKHLTQAPRSSDLIPEALQAVIFKVLEKDRSKRFAAAPELVAALAPFLEGPPGSLTRDDVNRLRNSDTETTAVVPLPVMETVAEAPSTTTAKERAFEQSLLEEVAEREKHEDRDGLQRLGEGHPRGSKVGDAAREALGRVVAAQDLAAEAELAFQRAWEDGRSASWRDFLAKHDGSARAEEAHRLVAEAEAFERATSSDSETQVRQFLQSWPDARHHLEAGILLAKLKQRAAELRAFEDARTHNTPRAWDLYLTAYPNGPHADEARQRVRALQQAALDAARVKEPADFEKAWETGTSAAWDRYLADHPQSPRLSEARSCRQEAMDFELATATNSPAMWRAFIKTWPEGRHRIEAEIRSR